MPVLRGRFRKPKERCLRTYQRIAHEYHGTCCDCFHPIEPGDEYEGQVMVYPNNWEGSKRRTWLVVLKRHIECPFDPMEEEAEMEAEYQEHIAIQDEEARDSEAQVA